MRLAEIKPSNEQLQEAIGQLAHLVVALNLDLLPDTPLSEEYLEEEYLLDEGFLDMLKGLGRSALKTWKAFTQKISTSSTPWAELAKSIGIPKLIEYAKKTKKSAGEVLKDLAKAAAQGGHGGGYRGHGGYGGGRGQKADPQELADRAKATRRDLNRVVKDIFAHDPQACATEVYDIILNLKSLLAELQQKQKAAGPPAPHPASTAAPAAGP